MRVDGVQKSLEHFFIREAGLGGICPLVVVCVGPGSLENVGVEVADPILESGLAADHLRSEGTSVECAFKGYDDFLCRAADHLAVGACDLDCCLNCLGAGREHERLAVGNGAYAANCLCGLNALLGRVQICAQQGLVESFLDRVDDLGIAVACVCDHNARGEIDELVAVRVAYLVAILGVIPHDKGLACVGYGLILLHFLYKLERLGHGNRSDYAAMLSLDAFSLAGLHFKTLTVHFKTSKKICFL